MKLRVIKVDDGWCNVFRVDDVCEADGEMVRSARTSSKYFLQPCGFEVSTGYSSVYFEEIE